MNLHEYQTKDLFKSYGIQVPDGVAISQADQVTAVVQQLGGSDWVVKAQVHAGGRGKAGGVKKVSGQESLRNEVEAMLGTRLVTHQTGGEGLPISTVLIEGLSDIDQELYLSALVDRNEKKVVFLASSVGGMDIEEVAASQPEKIVTIAIDPLFGVMPYQCRQLAFGIGLDTSLMAQFSNVVKSLYQLFVDKDLSLVEINPLVITGDRQILALDGKINIDDNAQYRQAELMQLRDLTQEDERESVAHQFDLNYVSLDGNIGCMVNGAGLAMATMDLIKLHGGEPANFLDVGGGITVDRVVEAFKLVLSDENVKAILVNIFGGIVRCDLIADGIVKAIRQVNVDVPVIVRLEGTNVEQGKEMLLNSGLDIVNAEGLTDAALQAIKCAKGEH